MHPSLRLAGLLPPLDCPHHVRRDDESPFREGVVVQAAGASKGKHAGSGGALVDVGLWDPIEATNGENVPEGTRVTVRMPPDQHSYGEAASLYRVAGRNLMSSFRSCHRTSHHSDRGIRPILGLRSSGRRLARRRLLRVPVCC